MPGLEHAGAREAGRSVWTPSGGTSLSSVRGLPQLAAGPAAAAKDSLPFHPGPHEGLGSMETTASSCAPASQRAAGAEHPAECRELGSWEAACRGRPPGPAAWRLGPSSER